MRLGKEEIGHGLCHWISPQFEKERLKCNNLNSTLQTAPTSRQFSDTEQIRAEFPTSYFQ